MEPFERQIRELTREINGQFPRPWMTDLQQPSAAKVFIVGYNPASAYSAILVDYERHLNALFNRSGEGCRALYREVTRTSPTRGNIERFSEKLAAAGVDSILETNAVCYGAGKSSDLKKPEHAGERDRGTEIFRYLVDAIRPRVIVVHGAGVTKEVSRVLRLSPALPRPPQTPDLLVEREIPQGSSVIVIPSLALPGYQNWPSGPGRAFCHWSESYLDQVVVRIAAMCRA